MGVDQLVTGGDVNDPVVDSLSTESLSNENGEPDHRFNRIDRSTDPTSPYQYTGDLQEGKEYKIFYTMEVDADVTLTIDGDDAGGNGNYDYYDATSTRQNGQDNFLIAEAASTIRPTGEIFLSRLSYPGPSTSRVGINHEPTLDIAQRKTDFGREGVYNNSTAWDSIEIQHSTTANDRILIELWERDYQ